MTELNSLVRVSLSEEEEEDDDDDELDTAGTLLVAGCGLLPLLHK